MDILMAEPVRQQVMAAIAATTDNGMKTVLLLMLGILEEIGNKIDAMRADEKGLRDAVLNGHAATHGRDHEWVSVQIQDSEIRARMYAWVARKMEDEENSGRSVRDIRDGALKTLLGGLALAFAVAYFHQILK
jgi:hypothetical protein